MNDLVTGIDKSRAKSPHARNEHLRNTNEETQYQKKQRLQQEGRSICLQEHTGLLDTNLNMAETTQERRVKLRPATGRVKKQRLCEKLQQVVQATQIDDEFFEENQHMARYEYDERKDNEREYVGTVSCLPRAVSTQSRARKSASHTRHFRKEAIIAKERERCLSHQKHMLD